MSDSQNPAPPTPPSDSPPPPPASPPPPAAPPPGGGAGSGGPRADGPRIPWEEREQRGFVGAFVDTVKLVVQQPAEAFGRIRADGDYVQPLLFGGLILLAVTLFNVLFSVLWGALFSSSSGLGAMAAAGGIGMMMGIVVIIVAPVVIVIMLFLMAGIFHGILSLAGGLNSSQTGFEGSFKVVAYASVSGVLGIIPIVGSLLHLGAFGYLSYIGLPRAHRCTDQQALYALIPLAICGGCGVLAMIFNTISAIFL
ncbi:MAG: YIP1 family protein [Thermoanaerobaculia bacterium]|nr:YIP1 family protein [Thermoanaerobaculia bacterium]